VSKLEVDKITPQSGTTLTIGEAGDTTVVNGLGTLPATIGSAAQVLSVNAGATGLVYGTAATDLSNLNATNLTSGTVPDGRFPSVLPAAGGQNLTSLQPAAIVGGTFGAINSANLTNLNATALTSGTLPDGRFPSTLPAISGANLTNLPAGGDNTPIVLAYLNGASTIPSNTATTFIPNGTLVNTNTVYNTSTGVFTPNVAGYYRIRIQTGGANYNGVVALLVRVGTSTDYFLKDESVSSCYVENGERIIYFNGSSNYATFRCFFQNGRVISGSSTTGNTILQIFKIIT